MERVGESLAAALEALSDAREAPGDGDRVAGLARVRESAERAAQIARRVEDMLGDRQQDSLSARIDREAELIAALEELSGAAADARDAAGERAAALERRMLGESGEDTVTEQLRACSREEAELQAKLRAAGERVTEAEVRVAHLGDRRAEAAGELAKIAATLGREIGPAAEALEEDQRTEIEVKLDRVGRRREQLGPVNPLAEAEYEQALEHVESLETQRADLESALSELKGLIRETDRKIHAAFEETFEATEKNFQELIEHLFPGGRGRLRLVDDARQLKAVLGGADAEPEIEAGTVAPGVEEGEEEPAEQGDEFSTQGVEIEVTPAGKAMRRLSLLSGGEKALVALAFVFSVFLARPSPFYILDEVEAALDDANIDRFLQLVNRFSDRAQFIVVTHQKRTMDAAEVLYGVSMGKGGATKIVSRRFDSEPAQAVLGEESEAA